jgi:hypothetical protein
MLPYKIVQDLNPAAAPENSSTLNVNVNFDILKQTLINEQGFDKLSTTGKEIIGSCILPDNSICIFSIVINQGISYSEIGVITDTTYRIVVRDKAAAASLGFTTEHQIKAESKVNFNGDYIVYWVDGFNPDRWLNITNPQIDIEFVSFLGEYVPSISNAAQLSLMFGFTPVKGEYIDQTATTVTGGSLTAAVYYIVCTYGDKYKNFTQTLYVSSPIPVTDSQIPFNSEYIGSAAGTITDKAITISIAASRLNLEYDYIRVQVIRKQNQVVTAWLFGEFLFGTSDFKCVIDELKNEIDVDSVLINLANYKSSLAITQLDDVLYKANLKSKPEFDFQPYVNNIKVNYIQKPVDLSSTNAGENYRDPNLCFYSKGFMYDEVYALYASLVIEEEEGFEYETDAYHIPGRKAAQLILGGSSSPINENDKITDVIANPLNYTSTYYVNGTLSDRTPLSQLKQVSDQAKVFHAVNTNDNASAISLYGSNMGYWENESETYFDNQSWVVKNASGVQTANYQGNKVRHHKFPEAYNSYASNKSIHPSTTNYNLVNILGVQLSNIVIPNEYIGKVKNIKLYYAKRDFNNRTILGQSLLETLMGLHAPGPIEDFDTQNKIFNSVGNILHTYMRSGPAMVNVNTGMFPLGYDRYTQLNDPNSWASVDTGGPNEFPTDDVSGYFKIKPFDMMQQALTPGTSTYMKNLYRVSGRYDALLDEGVNLTDADRSYKVNYIFDPTGKYTYPAVTTGYGPNYIFNGINRNITNLGTSNPLSNQYRKIVNAEYVNLNTPPTMAADFQSSPYNFTMLPFNYQGEKAIWVQTGQKLYPVSATAPTYAGTTQSFPDGDFAVTKYFYNNNDFKQSIVGGGLTYAAYVSPYISNICAFKLNLFTRFDNQVLCQAGVMPVGPSTIAFYGGDTFTSVYGERNTFNLKAYTPKGANQPDAYLDSIHCYIAQSTSNINYRYVGPNNWETFYPRTDFNGMNSLPIGINEEWFGYSPDYSSVNDLLQPTIQSNNVNQIQTSFPNRVIRSATDNPEIMNDNYLIYEAGNYRDVGKSKGVIENIVNQSNKLLIKTRNALFYTLGREVINTQNAESYVGAGDIFAVKPKESVSSDSYGGGIGRFSDVVTQYGYMYADATNGIVYVAVPSQGNSINEISNEGLQIFFRTELKFKLPKQLYDKYFSLLPIFNPAAPNYSFEFYVTFNKEIWKSNTSIASPSTNYPGQSTAWDKVDFYTLIDNTTDIQGIGIHAAFDYKYRRYILAKKDYNFINFSTEWLPNLLTAPLPPTPTPYYNKIVYYNGILYKLADSFDAPGSHFEPNGVFLPKNNYGVKINFAEYFEDKSFTMAYYPESKAWVSLYSYFPSFIFNTIDKVYSSKDTKVFKHNSEIQNNFYYDDNIIESFIEPILNSPAGVKKFSSVSFFTDVFVKTITTKALQYLDTFTSYFVRNTWQMSKETIINNTTTSRNAERIFNTNDFRDFTRNNADPLMDTKYISQQNASNLNTSKHWSLQKKFVDYFLIPRFKFKQEWILLTGIPISSVAFTNVMTSTTRVFNIGDAIKLNVIPSTTIIITKILSSTTYEFETREGGVEGFIQSSFDYLPSKEIHIYDINSQSTKNIR